MTISRLSVDFSAVIVLTAVLGLLGPSVTQTLIDNINTVAPGRAGTLWSMGQKAAVFQEPCSPGAMRLAW
jgi:hypothetical protein